MATQALPAFQKSAAQSCFISLFTLNFFKMSARPVVKTSHMNAAMQEFAIMAAQVAEFNYYAAAHTSLTPPKYDCRMLLPTSPPRTRLLPQSSRNLSNNTLRRKAVLRTHCLHLTLLHTLSKHYRWHCFIGRNFGCFVTHEASKFIYFYIGQTGICLFATA